MEIIKKVTLLLLKDDHDPIWIKSDHDRIYSFDA